mmetsp:Transcript_27785/g.36925  ORF Transcript_27785/g.36925 Transcript_27785/m.36925 type:complete len:121 (-) Transcript_27785:190-552(-)
MKNFSLFTFLAIVTMLIINANAGDIRRNKPAAEATIEKLERSIETGERHMRPPKDKGAYMERLQNRLRDLSEQVDAHESGRVLLNDEEKAKLLKRKTLVEQKMHRAQMSPEVSAVLWRSE